MQRIDFYILPDAALEPRALFACRLAEKIYKLKQRVYLFADDKQQAETLDKLLWSFQPASFVPHAFDGEESTHSVQIGWRNEDNTVANTMVDNNAATEPANADTVLINLSDSVPNFFRNFQRIAEIVVQTPEILATTRQAWRFYQQQGCTLERHDLRR